MKIISIKTDTILAEIGLWEDNDLLVDEKWEAHKQLADTIHSKIANILNQAQLNWDDIQAVVVFKGPGSFTGLRIGMSVANAIAYGLNIPIVSDDGEDWAAKSVKRILDGENEKVSLPEYGGEANITLPRK